MKALLNIVLALLAGFVGAFVYLHFVYVPAAAQAETFPTGSAMLVGNPSAGPDSLAANRVRGTGPGTVGQSFAEASARSTKSVVYIRTVSGQAYDSRMSWFDMFFGGGGGATGRTASSGSGVIVSPDGFIVTNNHVIDGAKRIEVVFNKRSLQATVVGTDPSTDLALLKVEAQGLPAIRAGQSSALQVGDWVLAVGNPFNLNSTVTAGIVSAKGRRINVLEGVFPIESFIQTDAAINPGNSGGALVNTAGELVGINTAILSQTGSYAGYGFAVPSDIVLKVVDDLKQFGEVQKAFLGAEVAELDENVSDKLGLDELDGVVVTQVQEGGAAMQAGLQRGDVIIKVDGQEIGAKADYDEKLSSFSPGDKIQINYLREGKEQRAALTLTNVEGTTGIVVRNRFESELLGAVFEAIPRLEKERLRIDSGVRIHKVVGRGVIGRMGLPEGFIIVSVNNYKVNDPQELSEILERIRGRVIIEGKEKNGSNRAYSYYF